MVKSSLLTILGSIQGSHGLLKTVSGRVSAAAVFKPLKINVKSLAEEIDLKLNASVNTLQQLKYEQHCH